MLGVIVSKQSIRVLEICPRKEALSVINAQHWLERFYFHAEDLISHSEDSHE